MDRNGMPENEPPHDDVTPADAVAPGDAADAAGFAVNTKAGVEPLRILLIFNKAKCSAQELADTAAIDDQVRLLFSVTFLISNANV
jgi:hypothetical protein